MSRRVGVIGAGLMGTTHEAWVRSTDGGGPSGAGAWDGYAAGAVADACLQSLARGGRSAVQLRERPALYG